MLLMRIESKVLAAGLSAALVAGGYRDSEPQESLRVGTSQWVEVERTIAQPNVGECMMIRGAGLVLKGGNVVYKNKDAHGTECPDGTVVSITPRAAKEQNKSYDAFSARRKEVINQVSNMPISSSEITVQVDKDWVDLVNVSPIEELGYGDSCLATGEAQIIGQLTTGEEVMRIQNPDQLGTECPTGALYLAPADQ